MKLSATWNTLQPLNASKELRQPKTRSLRLEIRELWQIIAAHLNGASEPRVWQSQTELGQTLWNAYDPSSRQTLREISAPDLQVWLEEQHYQNRSSATSVRVKHLCNLL